jgi:hypothetical protein
MLVVRFVVLRFISIIVNVISRFIVILLVGL